MKDNFSRVAKEYARFRPVYPGELFDFLFNNISSYRTAWDCGTGNGQIANVLADKFETVYATDISENQLSNAIRKQNIIYKIEPAEQTEFADRTFDLIVVAQAIHWFQFDQFYKEVYRTLNPDGLFAVLGYYLPAIDKDVDEVILDFYNGVLHGYWDPERQYLDEKYRTIPFPFQEIETPSFEMKVEWSLEEFIGFLNTWSAVHHFIRRNEFNPVSKVQAALQEIWKGSEKKLIRFPILTRIGRMQTTSA